MSFWTVQVIGQNPSRHGCGTTRSFWDLYASCSGCAQRAWGWAWALLVFKFMLNPLNENFNGLQWSEPKLFEFRPRLLNPNLR